MGNEEKESKEFFPQDFVDIENAIIHAIENFRLPVKITTSAIGVVSYFNGRKLIGCISPGYQQKLFFSLRFSWDSLRMIERLGVPVSSLEEDDELEEFYYIPKEIYSDKDLFPKIFKIAFESF